MEHNTLKDRVKKFIENERISNSEFSKLTGVSVAYVNSIKKNMSFEMLEKLYRINPRVSEAKQTAMIISRILIFDNVFFGV